MTISVSGATGPVVASPDNQYLSVGNTASVDECFFELCLFQESSGSSWLPAPTLGGVNADYSYADIYTDTGTSVDYYVTVMLWDKASIQAMSGYSSTGFSAKFLDGTSTTIVAAVYYYRMVEGNSNLYVKASEEAGSIADVTSLETGSFSAVEGDYFSTYGQYYTNAAEWTAVDNHTEVFDNADRAHRCHLFTYAVGAGGFDGTFTVTFSRDDAFAKRWTIVQYSETPPTVTYNRVLTSSFVVTDAQPGQIVSGQRPGERIEVFDKWLRRAVGYILQDALEVHDQIQYAALNTVNRKLYDTVPVLSDDFVKSFYGTYALDFLDTLQAEDFKRVIYHWTRNQIDSISVSDLFDVTFKLVRALYSQVPALYDNLISRYARMYMLRDSVVVRDNIIAQYIENEEEPTFVYNKLLIDGLLASDGIAPSATHILKDTLYATDGVTGVYRWRKVLTDSVNVTDDSLANELAPLVIGLEDFPIVINVGGYKIEIGVDE